MYWEVLQVIMDNERTLLMFGSLLHDIGKLVQRAQDDPWSKKHGDFGLKFIADNFGFLEKFLGNSFGFLPYFSMYHHDPLKINELDMDEETRKRLVFLLKIVQKADHISAGERTEKELESGATGSSVEQPMTSIFSSVLPIHHWREKCQMHYYPPMQFSKMDRHPVKSIEECYEKGSTDLRASYKVLMNGLKSDCIKNPYIKSDYLAYLMVENILQEYAKFVPSATYKHTADIPLFDHMKTTAAIATCIYDYLISKNMDYTDDRIFSKNDKMFTLIRGELSNIQKHIYHASDAQQSVEGSAKRLRARSMQVVFLMDSAANELLERLCLPSSNILLLAGGSFEIIAPCTESSKKILSEWERDTQTNLWKSYGIGLNLRIAKIDADNNMMTPGQSDKEPGYKNTRKMLWNMLLEQKNRQYGQLISDGMISLERQGSNLRISESCPICRKPAEGRLCRECETDIEFGKQVMYADRIVRSKIRGLRKILFHHYSFQGNGADDEVVYAINRKPDYREEHGIYALANYAARDQNGVLEFNALARGEGVERLGVLRMDVDNLGIVFTKGIEAKSYSVSRLNTLSTLLNSFFTSLLNRICEGKKAYVVYGGGDDLVIVGNWAEVLSLAKEINSEFRKYVCGNESLTISSGIEFIWPKEPIITGITKAGDVLEQSKNFPSDDEIRKKNAITAFSDTVSQERFSLLLDFGEKLKDYRLKNEISSGTLYSFIKLYQQSFGYGYVNKAKKMKTKRHVPLVHYMLARTVKDKKIRYELIDALFVRNSFDDILIPASYAHLALRKGD